MKDERSERQEQLSGSRSASERCARLDEAYNGRCSEQSRYTCGPVISLNDLFSEEVMNVKTTTATSAPIPRPDNPAMKPKAATSNESPARIAKMIITTKVNFAPLDIL